jgi:hypothetical protein
MELIVLGVLMVLIIVLLKGGVTININVKHEQEKKEEIRIEKVPEGMDRQEPKLDMLLKEINEIMNGGQGNEH